MSRRRTTAPDPETVRKASRAALLVFAALTAIGVILVVLILRGRHRHARTHDHHADHGGPNTSVPEVPPR